MLKFIFIDIGQVLIKVDFQKLFTTLADNSSKNRSEIEQFFNESSLIMQYRNGTITSNSFLEKFKSKINFRGNLYQLSEIWTDIFEPIQENIDLIKIIKNKYQLTFISNTNELHMRKIFSMIPDFKSLGHFILSYEVGLSKPDPQIFKYAMKEVNATSHESLFIDDEKKNVAAAEKLGLSVYRLDKPSNFKKALSELQIYT